MARQFDFGESQEMQREHRLQRDAAQPRQDQRLPAAQREAEPMPAGVALQASLPRAAPALDSRTLAASPRLVAQRQAISKLFGPAGPVKSMEASPARSPTRADLARLEMGADSSAGTIQYMKDVVQRTVPPPTSPPATGVRDGTLNTDGVPSESHITTSINGNDLIGTPPGPSIKGWSFIQSVNAAGSWVRFHLINESLGGLGDQDNLVPTSQATNHDSDWRKFERACQAAVRRYPIHVSVDVDYPAPAPGRAIRGTLPAYQHFYPNQISGECHRWDGTAWKSHRTVQVHPFPLQPPSTATKRDLTQQTHGWLRSRLMGDEISVGQAKIMHSAFRGNYTGGYGIQWYFNMSGEPIPELKLLDAIESFIAVELQEREHLTDAARVHIFNGAYHI